MVLQSQVTNLKIELDTVRTMAANPTYIHVPQTSVQTTPDPNSELLDHSYSILSYDAEKNSVVMQFEIIPKTFTDDMTARLSLHTDGTPIQSMPCDIVDGVISANSLCLST